MPVRRTLTAGQDASNAHHQVADAHLWQARYWQEAPHNSPRHHYEHQIAELYHRAKATEIESHCDDIRTYSRTYSVPDLLACKQRFLALRRLANAGLTQLRASNAYIQLTKRVKDHPKEAEIAKQIIKHGKESLEHSPYNIGRTHITAEMSISDGEEGIRRANQLFQEYRDGEERKSGEASSSNTDHH